MFSVLAPTPSLAPAHAPELVRSRASLYSHSIVPGGFDVTSSTTRVCDRSHPYLLKGDRPVIESVGLVVQDDAEKFEPIEVIADGFLVAGAVFELGCNLG